MTDIPSHPMQKADEATPQPDENPQQRAKLKEAAEAPVDGETRDGEDSLQEQAQHESRNSTGAGLKDENGRKTAGQTGIAPHGDEQETKRGEGQDIVS